jgi:thiamine pyrophosphate-dependent acetolactate synthase large subunit-like protein
MKEHRGKFLKAMGSSAASIVAASVAPAQESSMVRQPASEEPSGRFAMKTVRDVTYELLRECGITTIFGNVGSTEETFLKNFPSDFRYILGLQEASVIGIADGYAQATRRPALVNLHTGAGLGNAMGNLLTAFQNKTPLIMTSGQQTREMLLMEPWLTNVEPTILPRPWVKWAYEPVRAEDIPAAFMRAIATALQPPSGPVFLSLPLDDWEKPCAGPAVVRSVGTRIAPDHERLAEFAKTLSQASSPVLIYGASIARGNGWKEAVTFAEALGAPVWAAPSSERTPFPEDHPLYCGGLPFAIGPLSEKLKGHDVALIIGAPVFRYYPYVPGPYLPAGLRLLHISDDPAETARAPVGDSLLGTPSYLSLASRRCLQTTNQRQLGRTRNWHTGWRPTHPQKIRQMTDVCPLRKCSPRLTKFDLHMPYLSRRARQISAIFIRHGQSPSRTPSIPLQAEGSAGTFRRRWASRWRSETLVAAVR